MSGRLTRRSAAAAAAASTSMRTRSQRSHPAQAQMPAVRQETSRASRAAPTSSSRASTSTPTRSSARTAQPGSRKGKSPVTTELSEDSDSDSDSDMTTGFDQAEGEASSDTSPAENSDDDEAEATPTRGRRKPSALPSPPSTSNKRKRATRTAMPQTPSKRARILMPRTPPSSARSLKSVIKTPSSIRARSQTVAAGLQAAVRGGNTAASNPALVTPSQRDVDNVGVSLPYLQSLTPQQRAKRQLHVGLTPDKLPCREQQFDQIFHSVTDAIQERTGKCIYIAGVPGSGKTATVRAVMRQLHRYADSGKIEPFKYVEINGMKLGDASEVYTSLWQALRPDPEGKRTSPKFALAALNSYFSDRKPSSGGPPSPGRWRAGHAHTSTAQRCTVVLMDELDQLVHSRHRIMYNLFNWPHVANSRLIVLAVANTFNLPEQLLSAKEQSRLGNNRIPFHSYTVDQLTQIVQSRLGMNVKSSATSKNAENTMKMTPQERALAMLESAAKKGCAELFQPNAITLAARMISKAFGDARRVLDICRRAIEVVEARAEAELAKQRSVSQDSTGGNHIQSTTGSTLTRGSSRRAGEDAIAYAKAVSELCKPVTPADISDVYASMVKSAKSKHIASLPLTAKVLLIALLRCVRRSGLTEVRLGDVLVEHASILSGQGMNTGNEGKGDQSNGQHDWDATCNLAEIEWALATLYQTGLVIAVGSGSGHGRADINGRLILGIAEDDLRISFDHGKDTNLLNALG